jgi:hypothetical protein
MSKKNDITKPSLVREHRGRGNGLSLPEKEAIYQCYLALGSKAGAARALGVSESTVYKVCKSIEKTLPQSKLQEAREQMAVNLTGRYHESTVAILDSIKAEDIESGRILIKNKAGEIIGYQQYGPSLVAKATAAGIFTDKIKVLSDYERALGRDQQDGKLPMPETIEQLVQGIRGQLKSIQVMNINFAQENPDLATKVAQAVEAEVEVDNGVSGGFDFHNPD